MNPSLPPAAREAIALVREIQAKSAPAGYDSGDSGIHALATKVLELLPTPPSANAPQDTTAKDWLVNADAIIDGFFDINDKWRTGALGGTRRSHMRELLARHAPASTEDSQLLDWLDHQTYQRIDEVRRLLPLTGFRSSLIRTTIRAAMVRTPKE